MNTLIHFLMALFGFKPKAEKTFNNNNQPVIGARVPMKFVGKGHAPVLKTVSVENEPSGDQLRYIRNLEAPKPAVPKLHHSLEKATPATLLGLLRLCEVDRMVRIVSKDGKQPKKAKVVAPRSGLLLSHRILGMDSKSLILQRAGHPRGPVFTRPLFLVEQMN